MNKGFSKHNHIITNFRGVVGKADFEAKYVSATSHLSKNEQFLLKMELKRLATPCTRAIDLRGLVDGECQLFDYQGQQHFLDDVAINAFKKNVSVYGGYTFGVYEKVRNAKNSFRNIYLNEQANAKSAHNAVDKAKKSAAEKLQYPGKLHHITTYPNRVEERMNFAIAITIELENRENVNTTSIDISVSGIKFKLHKEQRLFKGEQVNIIFTGLEEEFQFNKDNVFCYQVNNVYRDGSTQIIGCQRVDVPEKDSFERFLQGYVQGNKRRYKINLDNSLRALQVRSLEQFALPNINELVIYMQNSHVNGQVNSSTVVPRYVLTSKNNQCVHKYWQDDKKRSTLHYLINKERFERLKAMRQQGRSLLVFSFIHYSQGSSFFYTLDEQQIQQGDKFLQQYLAFAASKSTFAITALNYQDITPEQAYSPFTLSSALTRQQGYLNSPLTDEVKDILNDLPYLVTATDITNTCNIDDYQILEFEGIDRERLKGFGHKQTSQSQSIDEILLSYGHQRQEMRFKYKTPAVIECKNVKWEGQSADFSVSGLKLELDSAAVLTKGDIVQLSFPNLQKITSAFDLKELPYKVIRINKDKTVVNLRVSVKEHQHIGRSFFKLLIDKNKGKLTPDEYAMLTPGLSSALRTVYGVNMSIPTAIVQSSGSRYKVESLLVGEFGYQSHKGLLSSMMKLSDRNGYYNLSPLLANLQVTVLIDQHMKKLLVQDPTVDGLLYIGISATSGESEQSVHVKLASELNTPELKKFFIKKSLKQGQFFCVQIKLSRSEEPHMDFLTPELSYISSYAIHRGKQLEQEIFSVAGLIQMFDVTQETLLRYSLSD